MQDRVRLVDASEIGARGVRASVGRDEIQDVLKSKDGEPELVLDVTRGDEPAQTLRLAWDPAELEELLGRTDGERLVRVRRLGARAAARGRRRRSRVAANSRRAGGRRHDSRRWSRVAQARSVVVSEREWPQAVPASTAAAPTSEQEWPQLVTGDAATPAATTHAALASEQEWPQAVPASTAAAPTSENEWPQLVTGDATPVAPTATPVAATSSEGTDAGTAAAVAGNAALLIAAAAFTVRRQHKVEPKSV